MLTKQQNVCAQFAYWLRIGKFGEKEHSEAWIYDSIAFSIIQCGLAEKYAEDPLETLADLIDPTCHLALDEELSQELQGEMFRCSKCDAAFPRINGEYQYCPPLWC